MTRVLVSGICGRMGGMAARSLAADDRVALAGGVEMPGHDEIGRRLCDVWNEGDLEVGVRSSLEEFDDGAFDVIVDYSTPAQAVACADRAAQSGKGLLVGTTGLTDYQLAAIQKASALCPIVVAPNTSVGVNLLFGLARRVAAILDEAYDVEIVETHHRSKRDAPSGTATRLVETVAEARGRSASDVVRAGRSGYPIDRQTGEVGVHSLRAGAVIGRHAVHFVSPLEQITLAHEAFSRQAFAQGAVAAALFLDGRTPGLYDMTDVLGLSETPAAG